MSKSTVALRLDAAGRIELALTAVRKSADHYCGFVMNAREDALFSIVRESNRVELKTTAGDAAWSRAWLIGGEKSPAYRELAPAQPIDEAGYEELATVAQDFVARWIWFKSGPHEEVAIEAQRFAAMNCAIDDANLRSAVLARIRSGPAPAHYSELDADGAWIEDAIARCWPGAGAA